MKQDYLLPFLKKANLRIPDIFVLDNQVDLPVNENPVNELVDEITGGAITDALKTTAKVATAIPLGVAKTALYTAPKNLLYKPLQSIGKNVYRNMVASKEEVLALMIKDAIQKALKNSVKNINADKEKLKQIQTDIQTIKKMILANKIDMDYGGGLLVFGPDFHIQKMIHFFDKNYFSTEIGAVMKDDAVQSGMTQAQAYSSKTIADEIIQITSR